MGREVIRNASIYVDGEKRGLMETATLDMTTNAESQVGDGQHIGESKGVILSTLTSNEIIKVGGTETTPIRQAFLNQRYVQVQWFSAGQVLSVDCAIRQYQENSTSQSGTLKGTFTFNGGQPEVIGL